MDIFIEHMVKKRKTAKDYLKVVLCILSIVGMLGLMVLSLAINYIGLILFVVCGIVIYIIGRVASSINTEYEYAFTNGALDVDKIIAAKRRRRMASLNARSIEIMASVDSDRIDPYLNDRSIKRKYACTHIYDNGVYFVIYADDKNKYMLLFNPNEGIKDGFKRLNSQKVFLED